jgi:thiol-disulfide isomerase/thioredoxin
MRKILYTTCILLACCSIRSQAAAPDPADSAYTLKGKIEGMGDGWVWVYHRQTEKKIDSAKVKDGSFVITGYSPAPEYCLLGIPGPNNKKEWRLGFFLQSGELTLTGKKDEIAKATIKGSPVQDEFRQFNEGQKDFDAVDEKLSAIYKTARMNNNKLTMDSVEKASGELEKKRLQYVKDYAASHPASYVTAYSIYANYSYNPEVAVLDSLYKALDPAIQASYFGKQIRVSLDAAELTDIGKPAPAFVQNDVNGKPVSLASFKGQYVLVDFWASWCGPCRAENPNVVKVYKTYHAKGFAILGVSLDDSREKWLAAIKKDQLEWTHVSDLKGWQNSVADLYGVKGIPMNYLLDKDGKIIARGLRGEDLEKKLAELVK